MEIVAQEDYSITLGEQTAISHPICSPADSRGGGEIFCSHSTLTDHAEDKVVLSLPVTYFGACTPISLLLQATSLVPKQRFCSMLFHMSTVVDQIPLNRTLSGSTNRFVLRSVMKFVAFLVVASRPPHHIFEAQQLASCETSPAKLKRVSRLVSQGLAQSSLLGYLGYLVKYM